MSFDDDGAPGEGESGGDGVEILTEETGEALPPSSSASAPAPSTTTSPTCRSCEPAASPPSSTEVSGDPRPHRLKGGALQLGVEEPGLLGLFGTWTDQVSQEDEHDPAEDAELNC
ncbi:hypothetical protein ACFVH9_12535 [Streptomyces hirsutus]|uniref:hypothetical protein n=1 Tax=Streptomyces hirsutus TaxID=35620 RepID=UPI00363B0F64